MTCVVFGASGPIGRFLLPHLMARDMPLVAISRRPHATTGRVLWLQGQLPDRIPRMPEPLGTIISLGPLDHLATWLAHADVRGAPRVVAMSSMSAQSKVDSPDPAERALALRLQDAERRLLARCAELGSACTIFRATLIYGGGGTDDSLARLAKFALRWRVFPLPRGRGLRQPVHAEDLALAVLAALNCPASAGRILAIGGAERLSASAMFARVHDSLQRRTLPLPLLRPLLQLASRLSGRGRGMVARLQQDLLADNTEMIGLLDVRPRAFTPGEALHYAAGGRGDTPGKGGKNNQYRGV